MKVEKPEEPTHVFHLQAIPRDTIFNRSQSIFNPTQSTGRSAQGLQPSGPKSQVREDSSKIKKALSQTLPNPAKDGDVLSSVVEQLSLCQADELHRLKAWTGLKKQLAVYR